MLTHNSLSLTVDRLEFENERLRAIEVAARALFIGSIDTGFMTEVSTEKFDALGKLLTQQ